MTLFAMVLSGQRVFAFHDRQTERLEATANELYMVLRALCGSVLKASALPEELKRRFPVLVVHFLAIVKAWWKTDRAMVQREMEHMVYRMHLLNMPERLGYEQIYLTKFGQKAAEALFAKVPQRVYDLKAKIRNESGSYANEQISHELILDPQFKSPRHQVPFEVRSLFLCAVQVCFL